MDGQCKTRKTPYCIMDGFLNNEESELSLLHVKHLLVLLFIPTKYGSNPLKNKGKQEAHGPRVAHLSDIATADMQMLCNIFPILSSQLMKRSSFKQFFILKKKIYGMPVN